MLDTDTAARLDAIGKLGFTNPFGPERPRLEAVIVGEDVARSLPWSRSLDWPLEDPALPAIQEEAERQMAEAQAGLARGKAYTKRERDLIRGVALYVLYYRYDTELYQSITSDSPANTVTFYDAFNNDFHELFKWVEPPTWAATPADLFALFFQTRRAFHFVFHQILGTSVAAAKLRANVWESLFTHDPWRYLRRFARDYRTGFHPLHLAAMSKTLIESELFGHKKGAFTGASADRMGHLEGRSASETIFLDEIGELDPEIQVKLLRVLQSRAFHRLGDTEPRSFGGKVVAATNRDLSREMEAGRFREDLYYRLCSDVIQTPSLQEQVAGNVDELGHLVSVLVQRTLGSSDSATFEEIMSGIEQGVGYDYPWPGNIRELEQCVRNLLIHGHYHPPMAPSQAGTLDPLFNQMQAANATLDEVVSTYTTWVYTQRGSYTQAATTLEIDRRTVAKHIGDT
ncbi:MAG: sigma 54-interacting transcriptional regulator [Deltaproteobacteria bacterium]|nr:sigma 54-interacting transcriptional regulator [Deltaproteobacteria bacterium]